MLSLLVIMDQIQRLLEVQELLGKRSLWELYIKRTILASIGKTQILKQSKLPRLVQAGQLYGIKGRFPNQILLHLAPLYVQPNGMLHGTIESAITW